MTLLKKFVAILVVMGMREPIDCFQVKVVCFKSLKIPNTKRAKHLRRICIQTVKKRKFN